MTSTRYVAAALVALAMAATGYVIWRALPSPAAQTPSVPYVLLDGEKRSSDQWKGQVMLVNFWATTCAVCVAEMPEIVATHRRFKKRGFDTLAISMPYDPPASVARFAETRQLPFGVAIDNTGALSRSFGPIEGTPTTLLIDRQGRIVWRHMGRPDFAALHARIDQLLSAGT